MTQEQQPQKSMVTAPSDEGLATPPDKPPRPAVFPRTRQIQIVEEGDAEHQLHPLEAGDQLLNFLLFILLKKQGHQNPEGAAVNLPCKVRGGKELKGWTLRDAVLSYSNPALGPEEMILQLLESLQKAFKSVLSPVQNYHKLKKARELLWLSEQPISSDQWI